MPSGSGSSPGLAPGSRSWGRQQRWIRFGIWPDAQFPGERRRQVHVAVEATTLAWHAAVGRICPCPALPCCQL